ncbi:MAG: hypothetical protein AB8E15_07655 [Bdellovibrionales bacterium]
MKPIFYFVIVTICSSFSSAEIPCGPLKYPTSYESIQDYIDVCKPNNAESLVASLPEEMRSKYTLIYQSRALGEANYLFPRVIFFGLDAKTVASFGGHSSLRGYEAVEFIEFDETEKDFNLYAVRFPEDIGQTGPVTISEKNPNLCIACHVNRKPLWDTYEAWPGVYGSEDDRRPASEQKWYNKFLSNTFGKVGRYKYFSEKEYPRTGFNQEYYPERRNMYFAYALMELNGIKVANELGEIINTNPEIKIFRFAILHAMVCHKDRYSSDENLLKFLPEEALASFNLNYSEIYENTKYHIKKSLSNRQARQDNNIPNNSYRLRNVEFYRMTARLRWILENLGIKNLDNFSMEFGETFTLYPGPHFNVGGLEVHLFKEIMERQESPKLYDLMSKREAEGDVNYNTDEKCEFIRSLSLKELSSFNSSEIN